MRMTLLCALALMAAMVTLPSATALGPCVTTTVNPSGHAGVCRDGKDPEDPPALVLGVCWDLEQTAFVRPCGVWAEKVLP